MPFLSRKLVTFDPLCTWMEVGHFVRFFQQLDFPVLNVNKRRVVYVLQFTCLVKLLYQCRFNTALFYQRGQYSGGRNEWLIAWMVDSVVTIGVNMNSRVFLDCSKCLEQCCPTRGPHAAREGISCGPPSSHINCSFGPVVSQMKSTCKIQQCLMVFCVSKFQENGRICGFHSTFGSKKCFSFRGASPPDPPTRGSAPGSRCCLLYTSPSPRD